MKFKSGLTLTELMIAVSLLGLVIISAVAMNTAAERFLAQENAQVRLANDAAVTLEYIAKDILQSFGDPVNGAFHILDPGTDSGNYLQLRRADIAPTGADVNDRWVGYRYDNANHIIEYNNDLFGAGNWVTIARNVVATNPIFQALDADSDGNALNDNLIRIEITSRQDVAQPESIANPEVSLVSAARISAVSSR